MGADAADAIRGGTAAPRSRPRPFLSLGSLILAAAALGRRRRLQALRPPGGRCASRRESWRPTGGRSRSRAGSSRAPPTRTSGSFSRAAVKASVSIRRRPPPIPRNSVRRRGFEVEPALPTGRSRNCRSERKATGRSPSSVFAQRRLQCAPRFRRRAPHGSFRACSRTGRRSFFVGGERVDQPGDFGAVLFARRADPKVVMGKLLLRAAKGKVGRSSPRRKELDSTPPGIFSMMRSTATFAASAQKRIARCGR